MMQLEICLVDLNLKTPKCLLIGEKTQAQPLEIKVITGTIIQTGLGK